MRPRFASQALACVLLVTGQANATYWINSIDDYDSLPVCAEAPVSSIVRDMVSGCGDGGSATSYSCFCTRSSKEFNSIIATAVAKECSQSGTQVRSATSIFHAYCELGSGASTTVATVTATTTSSSPMSTTASNDKEALRTSVATESLAESSAISLAGDSKTPSSSKTLSTGSKIAIGICVPITAIALAGMAFVLLRRRRSADPTPDQMMLESRENIPSRSPHELTGGHYPPRVYEKPELDGRVVHQPARKYELE